MKTSLRICRKCKEYTLKNVCPRCGMSTSVPIPPRYSPEDRWGAYRRMLLKQRRENDG